MKKFKAILTLIYLRLNSETPKFFKFIFKICAVLLTLGASLVTLDMPKGLEDLPKMLILIGTVGGTISKLTTCDPQLQKSDPIEAIKPKHEETEYVRLKNLR